MRHVLVGEMNGSAGTPFLREGQGRGSAFCVNQGFHCLVTQVAQCIFFRIERREREGWLMGVDLNEPDMLVVGSRHQQLE